MNKYHNFFFEGTLDQGENFSASAHKFILIYSYLPVCLYFFSTSSKATEIQEVTDLENMIKNTIKERLY